MKYTVTQTHSNGTGAMTLIGAEANEALEFVKGLIPYATATVEIIGADGNLYELAELERIVAESTPPTASTRSVSSPRSHRFSS